MGANVVGVSKDIPTTPSMFEVLGLQKMITHYFEDIRELDKIEKIIQNEKPSFLFHLAAQAIVSKSYTDPIETITSNVMGTTNILEALRHSDLNCCAVMITSDKAYDNVEQVWGYNEDDKLGGKDIYSGSKGAAEQIIKSYYNSFFSTLENGIKLIVGRAGNVIGGGDWAKDRIVVDCMVSWDQNEKVEIRSPNATRPWQHVLEPLSGYLNLGKELHYNDKLNGEAFNFGPRAEQNTTVRQLLEDLSEYWHFKDVNSTFTVTESIPFHEAGLLKLNCDKALSVLKWQATLEYEQTIRFVSEWYYDYYKTNKSIYNKTIEQLNEYEKLAEGKRLKWSK